MKKIFLTCTAIILLLSCASEPAISEFRGVWITNVDSRIMDSRENIQEAMQFLADAGFNVVMPVVWNDAWTLYPSDVMDKEFGRLISPHFEGRDPLREICEEAHKNDLLVIPWFEYGFAASYNKNGGFLLKKKPHWGAQDINGNLLKKNGFEWMNAYHPEVQKFILSLILEVVQNYDVDGIQGDDRLPAQPSHGGYSNFTQKLYASEHNGNMPPSDPMDPDWLRWRGNKLNKFAGTIYDAVKTKDPHCLVTWAPSVFPWSYEQYLQDWPTWCREGHADLIIPQIYRYDLSSYEKTLTAIDSINTKCSKIIPGVLLNVGSYVMNDSMLAETIAINRNHGYAGEIFFFYEGLRKNNDSAGKIVKKSYKKETK